MHGKNSISHSLLLFFALLLLSIHEIRTEEDAGEEQAYAYFDDIPVDLGAGPLRTACTFADQIVPPLKACNVTDIFKENFFLMTSPINTRSLLDEPLFYKPIPHHNEWKVEADFFFNRSSKTIFSTPCHTKDKTRLSTVLGFESNSLIKKIETSLKSIQESPCGDFFINQLGLPRSFLDTDVRMVASLFSPINLQEHRAGIMLNVIEKKDDLAIGLAMPLYWIERNFYISKRDQNAIKQAKLFPEEKAPSPKEAFEFAQEHLISDLVGIGDLRAIVAYQLVDTSRAFMHIGFQVTIPTAAPAQRGVLGSEFLRCLRTPAFDLCQVLNLGLDAVELEKKLKKDFDQLGKNFLDRLSAIVAEPKLGSGHWGIGLFFDPNIIINDTLSWNTKFSYEVLLPGSEKRFFIKKFNATEFDSHDFESDDETIAEENLRFLNARLLNIFFPTEFDVSVLPGSILTLYNKLDINHKRFTFSLGSDFWYKDRDRFHHQDSFFWMQDKELKTAITKNLADYEVDLAKRDAAYQLKLFGGLSYKISREESDWFLFLNGDATVLNSGIGKDFTMCLGTKVNW